MDDGSTTVVEQKQKGGGWVEAPQTGGAPRAAGPGRAGFFTQYKPEQGKITRTATFIGLGLVIAWGAKFLSDRLAGFEGDEGWRLLITPGMPILFAVVLGALAWHFTFVHRKASDFMIATEGEMKKVSWSSKNEVIGSTKVVILFTVLLAIILFVADILFQKLFTSLGVLKV
jgi:preprotein translocase subunit SecE